MDRTKQHLVITLKSDLCAGSGYSYAGIVDSDVCYDIYGIPYIPAKRLKGCLREAAGLIGLTESEIEQIFGKAGREKAQGVFLGNAYIEGYEELYRELKEAGPLVRQYMTSQNVLDQFTMIKAQTKILENGVAKDNSLRYTRTINHYSPLDREKELLFIADVCCRELDTQAMQNFKNTVKALRKIGLNRNRGLGSVTCRLSDPETVKPMEIDFGGVKDEEDYILTYSVKNLDPLVLNMDYDDITEKYISGQTVMGWFAGAYLREGNSEDTAEFRELFLKDQVIFSGLYPEDRSSLEDDGKTGDIYYPAPAYVNQLKKTKKYVNTTKQIPVRHEDCAKYHISAEYASGEGNQPKKLKGKFVCFKEDKLLVKEVDTDLAYHYTKKSKKQNARDGELLFSFEAVRERQDFTGTIRGKGKYLKVLGRLLEQGELRFGKSKSSQYGRCVLNGAPQIRKAEADTKRYPCGSRVLVVLQSDGIFVNESGYTARCKEIREQIREKLKIQEKESPAQEREPYSEIEVRMLTGYYSKWNLRRLSVPAVRAGSAFEFELSEELRILEKDLYAGIRVGEGYGRLLVMPNDGKDFRIQEAEKPAPKTQELKHAGRLFGNILLDEMKERLGLEALRYKASMKNPAALGRVTLMLSDSVFLYLEDPDRAYENFCTRIASIKTKETRTQIQKIKNECICGAAHLSADQLKYTEKIKDLKKVYEEEILDKADSEKMRDAFYRELKKLWSSYLMGILVQEKYRLKQKERQEDHNSAG